MTIIQIGYGRPYQIDMGKTPASDGDYLAYAMGFVEGVNNERRARPTDWKGLDPSYVAGHAHGKRVHDGLEALPSWATLAEKPNQKAGA